MMVSAALTTSARFSLFKARIPQSNVTNDHSGWRSRSLACTASSARSKGFRESHREEPMMHSVGMSFRSSAKSRMRSIVCGATFIQVNFVNGSLGSETSVVFSETVISAFRCAAMSSSLTRSCASSTRSSGRASESFRRQPARFKRSPAAFKAVRLLPSAKA